MARTLSISIILLLSLQAPLFAQAANPASGSGCFGDSAAEFRDDAGAFLGRDLRHVPREMVAVRNLKWELPILAASAALISSGDAHINRQVAGNPSLIDASTRASNDAIYFEGATVLGAFAFGCLKHDPGPRSAAVKAAESGGFALLGTEALKEMTNRQRPFAPHQSGFWDGGTSFPSGHATLSWAIASALAHSYPHKRLVKWGVYGLATGISVLRVTANQHSPSDVLIGATIGYVTGAYFGGR